LALASQEPADCLNSAHGLAIVHNSSTHVLLAMDRGALRVATDAFHLSPNEVALLEGAVPGEALVLCAGERLFLDVIASPAEQELFDTRPSEQADHNRERRRQSLHFQPPPIVLEQTRAEHSAVQLEPARPDSSSSDMSWHVLAPFRRPAA
jgi:hypothetical protein